MHRYQMRRNPEKTISLLSVHFDLFARFSVKWNAVEVIHSIVATNRQKSPINLLESHGVFGFACRANERVNVRDGV